MEVSLSEDKYGGCNEIKVSTIKLKKGNIVEGTNPPLGLHVYIEQCFDNGRKNLIHLYSTGILKLAFVLIKIFVFNGR